MQMSDETLHSAIKPKRAILRRNIVLLLITMAAVAVAVFILNHYTPFISDDFGYLRVTGFTDAFRRAALHRQLQNGRTLMTLLLYLVLLLPPVIIDIINTAFFVLLCWCAAILATGSIKKVDAVLFLLPALTLFCVVPIFGSTTLWVAGAASYLWPATLVLLFLLPYRLASYEQVKRGNASIVLCSILMLAAGIIAGWSTEGTGAAALVIVFCSIIMRLMQKQSLPPWMMSGFVGLLFGYYMLASAPGVALRRAALAQIWGYQSSSTFALLKANMVKTLQVSFEYNKPMLLFFVAAVVIFIGCAARIKEKNWTLIFLLGAIAAYLPAIIAKSARGQFFTGVLLVVGAMVFFIQLLQQVSPKTMAIVFAAFAFVSGSIYSLALQDSRRLNRYSIKREQLAKKQMAQGKMELKIPRLEKPPQWMQWSATWEEANYGMQIPQDFAERVGAASAKYYTK
jgi:hypothetical protein